MRKFFILFLLFCLSGFINGQNSSFWKPVDAGFDSLVSEIETNFPDFYQFRTDKLNIMVKKLYDIASHTNNNILLSRALYWDAYNRTLSNRDSADFILDKAVSLTDTTAYPYDYARIKYIRGIICEEEGDLSKAYRIFNEIGNYFVACDDEIYTANTFVRLGLILQTLKDYSESIKFFEKANLYYEKANVKIFILKNQLNISNLLYSTGETEKAIRILEQLISDSTCREDTSFFINTMLSLSSYTPDNAKFINYAKKIQLLAKPYGNKGLLIRALLTRGNAFYKMNIIDSALYYYHQAQQLAINYKNDMIIQRLINGSIANAYVKAEQWDSVHYYSVLFQAYCDSIYGSNKISEINKIQQATEIQRYEFRIQKAQLQRKIWLLIIIALSCISVLLFIVFNIQRKKSRTEKQLKLAEIRGLNQKLKNEVLQKEHFQMEIDFKNRELVSNTIISSKTNQVLENLINQIDAIGRKGVLSKDDEIRLKGEIKNQLHSEDYWEAFKLHFDKVHPVFFQQLKELYPLLSENELHLCAYIRIGMTNKQISQFLSVLPESIHTSRYRLRKKLGLSSKDSLEDYLRQF